MISALFLTPRRVREVRPALLPPLRVPLVTPLEPRDLRLPLREHVGSRARRPELVDAGAPQRERFLGKALGDERGVGSFAGIVADLHLVPVGSS